MLLKDETAEFVKQYDWLRPHFATAEGNDEAFLFQAFVLRSRGKNVMIDTCIGADRKREYEVFCNLETSFLGGPGGGRIPGGERLRGAVYAPALRSCRLEHAPGEWTPGATFPQARYLFGKQEFDHWQQLREAGGTTTWRTCTMPSTRSFRRGSPTTSRQIIG